MWQSNITSIKSEQNEVTFLVTKQEGELVWGHAKEGMAVGPHGCLVTRELPGGVLGAVASRRGAVHAERSVPLISLRAGLFLLASQSKRDGADSCLFSCIKGCKKEDKLREECQGWVSAVHLQPGVWALPAGSCQQWSGHCCGRGVGWPGCVHKDIKHPAHIKCLSYDAQYLNANKVMISNTSQQDLDCLYNSDCIFQCLHCTFWYETCKHRHIMKSELFLMLILAIEMCQVLHW